MPAETGLKSNPGKFITVCIAVIILIAGNLFLAGEVPAALVKADKVLVIKSKRELILLNKGRVLKTYRIALGKQPIGKKVCAGDKRTPEGRYTLDYRKPDSKYHLALHLSYPNHSDREHAQKMGLSPGGDIMIHGLPDGYEDVDEYHRITDWTDGCIAVTNREIEEIWSLVPVGTPIVIVP
jgi:murein L,D-transpeptidase YafK